MLLHFPRCSEKFPPKLPTFQNDRQTRFEALLRFRNDLPNGFS